jgi:hypothetical protein
MINHGVLSGLWEDLEMSFNVGVAVRDITPSPGAHLWGYRGRVKPAEGTLDPLFAKALVFQSGDDRVAILSLDLGRVPANESCERIRGRAAEIGVKYVFFAATHTHHGPVMENPDASYMPFIEKEIFDTINEAAANSRPAKIGVARTFIDIAHNRRKIRDDGKCVMIWRNETRVETSPVDREALVVKLTDLDGAPLATLVNFACHPVVMGCSNYLYSADYVGELTRLVKEGTGAECVFLQGACGNINPYLDKTPVESGGVEAMLQVGRECADAVLAAYDAINTSVPESPSVTFEENLVPVGTRWNLDDPASADALRRVHGSMFDLYFRDARPDLAVPMSVVILNKKLALVGMPGEIFIQHQIVLKEKSPIHDTLFCGFANGYFAYFPTIKDALAGGYGGTTASFVGLGAGEKLVTEAVISIARLSGGCDSICSDDDFIVLAQE